MLEPAAMISRRGDEFGTGEFCAARAGDFGLARVAPFAEPRCEQARR